MRSSTSFASWVFRAAVAVTAAAVADPIVERMSDAGLFGPGRFTDHSNIDVVPALCIASALSVVLIALLARRLLSRGAYPPAWLRRCADDVQSRSLLHMLPSIFAVQLGVLFAMETIEQIATAGHPLGGMVWLGGPIAVSVIVHLTSCLAFSWALSRALNWSARGVARVVRFVLEFLRKLLEDAAPPILDIRYAVGCNCIEPYLRALQGRAPPVLSAANP